MENFKKSDLVASIASENNVTKASVERFLKSLEKHVVGAVGEGKKVTLPGFVAFEPAVQKARSMKNPQNGDLIKVAEKKTVKVRPLVAFKESIREK